MKRAEVSTKQNSSYMSLWALDGVHWYRVAICFVQGSVSLALNLTWWSPAEAFGKNISMNSQRLERRIL